MREVSEKRFDDPEKKLSSIQNPKNDVVDNRSLEEKQESEISNEMRLLENQYREEQRQYDEQLTKLLEQKTLLGETPDKQLLDRIQIKARLIVENKAFSARKYISARQKLNSRYSEYSKDTLPQISEEIKLYESAVQQAKEPLKEKETDTPTFKTKIDGNDVEYRKDENEDEMWYINGEETASKKTTRYDIVTKETTQAYKEAIVTKNGIDFPTKVRVPELDTTFEETILLHEGKENGVITKTDVPLLTDINGELLGRQIQTETERKDFRATKTVSTFENFQDMIEQNVVLDGDKSTFTNSVNGKPVFRMERTSTGTVITQYHKNGYETQYHYDKDGNPMEKNGYMMQGDKKVNLSYPGIPHIPNEPEGLYDLNRQGEQEVKDYDDFMGKVFEGGIPKELNDRLKGSIPGIHEKNPIIRQAKAVRDKGDNTIEDKVNQGIEFDD